MNVLLVFGILTAVVAEVAVVVVAEEDIWTKYDNIDFDAIIRNERLLNNYLKCFLDKGVCTAEGAVAKKNIPDVLQTDCGKCTVKEKEFMKKMMVYVYEKKKDAYLELESKFDPDGKFMKKYKDVIKG